MKIKPPFSYFGGKGRVAHHVWAALGNVSTYIEPFAGSLAVLLNRPDTSRRNLEIVNDLDGYIANFWRAAANAPDEVARWADWPINENDLHARHKWLVSQRESLVQSLENDPDWFDAKIAGWWVWGQSIWLGGEWCSGKIRRRKPCVTPRGVHRTSIVSMSDYFNTLAQRLRYVLVYSGDWQRVLTNPIITRNKLTGIFLDPPYGVKDRDNGVYACESLDVSAAVREWALAHGDDPRYRIVLAGYDGEHEMPDNWRVMAWTGGSPFGSGKKAGRNKINRQRERLWFSPHCISEETIFTQIDDSPNHES